MFFRLFCLSFIVCIACFSLTACDPARVLNNEAARRLAGPAQMIERKIDVGDFTVIAHERIHERGGVAHLYIEGDDSASDELIALQLAARDNAENLIHLMRPCQFTPNDNIWTRGMPQNQAPKKDCDSDYNESDRFDPLVIRAYDRALDDIKARWGLRGFHLYGHSGGAGLAVFLADRRHDVLSLTTVSGLLDTEIYHKDHGTGRLEPFTRNPATLAPNLADLPQYHYIGLSDPGMMPAMLYSYLQALGPTHCAQYRLIQENGYTAGWAEKWPDLVADKPVCRGIIKPLFEGTDMLTQEQ